MINSVLRVQEALQAYANDTRASQPKRLSILTDLIFWWRLKELQTIFKDIEEQLKIAESHQATVIYVILR